MKKYDNDKESNNVFYKKTINQTPTISNSKSRNTNVFRLIFLCILQQMKFGTDQDMQSPKKLSIVFQLSESVNNIAVGKKRRKHPIIRDKIYEKISLAIPSPRKHYKKGDRKVNLKKLYFYKEKTPVKGVFKFHILLRIWLSHRH